MQGHCQDFGGGGGGGGGLRLDLPEFFQLNVFAWFCDACEVPPWLAQSQMFWKFEVSGPLEMAFLESFLPNISIF
jgi:hypothetical protein